MADFPVDIESLLVEDMVELQKQIAVGRITFSMSGGTRIMGILITTQINKSPSTRDTF
jgi:hypothetical protein